MVSTSFNNYSSDLGNAFYSSYLFNAKYSSLSCDIKFVSVNLSVLSTIYHTAYTYLCYRSWMFGRFDRFIATVYGFSEKNFKTINNISSTVSLLSIIAF